MIKMTLASFLFLIFKYDEDSEVEIEQLGSSDKLKISIDRKSSKIIFDPEDQSIGCVSEKLTVSLKNIHKLIKDSKEVKEDLFSEESFNRDKGTYDDIPI